MPILLSCQKKILAGIITTLIIEISSMSAIAEPSLLWRMKFDSRIIKMSYLREFKTEKRNASEFPLKALMTEKSIYTLDSKGQIASRIPLKKHHKVAMSDDGSTMATMEGRDITISDLNGQIQGRVKIADPQPVVLPQHVSFDLSPNGGYIVLISYFTNTVYFHDKNGKLLSNYSIEDLRGAKTKFSMDSRYVAIHVPNWGEGKTHGYLLFFDKGGKKLWQFNHKGTQAKFDISSNGKSVVLAAEDVFYSINDKGKLIFKQQILPGYISIRVSDDGRYVVLTRRLDHTITMLDNINGKTLWQLRLDGYDPINSPFTSLDISGKENCVAVCISKDWKRKNKESFFYVFNKAGNVIWENTFDRSIVVGVMCPHDGCMIVKGDREGYLYKFNFCL